MRVFITLLVLSTYAGFISAAPIAKLVADAEREHIPFVDQKSGLTMFKVESTRGIVYHYLTVDNFDINAKVKKYPDAPIHKLSKLLGRAQGMSAASEMCKTDSWRDDVLKKGIKMVYIYYDKNKNYMTEYSFDNSDCRYIDEELNAIDIKIDLMEKKYNTGWFKSKKYNWND